MLEERGLLKIQYKNFDFLKLGIFLVEQKSLCVQVYQTLLESPYKIWSLGNGHVVLP